MDADTMQRIARLELRVKRDRWGPAILAAILCAMVSISAANDERVSEVIRAREIQVVNSQGVPVCRIMAMVDRGSLQLTDLGGHPVINASVTKEGGLLEISDGAGQPLLVASGMGAGRLTIWNKTGEQVIRAYVTDSGNGQIGTIERPEGGQTRSVK